MNEWRFQPPGSTLTFLNSLIPLNWKYFPFCDTDLTRNIRFIGFPPCAFAMQETTYFFPATSGIGAEQSSGHLYCAPLRRAAWRPAKPPSTISSFVFSAGVYTAPQSSQRHPLKSCSKLPFIRRLRVGGADTSTASKPQKSSPPTGGLGFVTSTALSPKSSTSAPFTA